MSDDDGLSGLSFERPIPQAVRKFGKALDPDSLEPGDLLLVSREKHNWILNKITRYQAKMFPEEHARWYHAAVSGGRYEICEATGRGVKCYEYWGYMTGEYDLKVRRLKGADAVTRYRLAYFAASANRTGYGFFNLFKIMNYMTTGDDWSRRLSFSNGVIFSQLYFEACMRVGYLLANIRPEAVCPAQLSMSPILEDIPLTWVKV